MSFVTIQAELLALAAGNLQGIGSATTAGNAAAAAPTLGLVPGYPNTFSFRRVCCSVRPPRRVAYETAHSTAFSSFTSGCSPLGSCSEYCCG